MDTTIREEEEERPVSEGKSSPHPTDPAETPFDERDEIDQDAPQDQDVEDKVQHELESSLEQEQGDQMNANLENNENQETELQEGDEHREEVSTELENQEQNPDEVHQEEDPNELTQNESTTEDHELDQSKDLDEPRDHVAHSPTSEIHRDAPKKKARPQRKNDMVIAEEDGQEDGMRSPPVLPLESISQNLDESDRYHHGHEPEILKPTTPDRMNLMTIDDDQDQIDEEPQVKLTREEIIAQLHAAIEERERNQNINNQLHHKLADYFRKRKPDDAQNQQIFEKTSQDQEQRYNKYLTNIEDLRKQMEKQQDEFEEQKYDLREKCEEKQELLKEERTKYLKIKKEIASKAISGHTGKPVQMKDIEAYLQKEQQKELEVTQVRLENIKLKNQLKKRENQLKAKEELGEGLHLIDFEQLKIENQTYNEKIEERNEELMKLKKKINNTVQILTHVKEKLKFVSAENEKEKDSLGYYDEDVKKKRDILNRIKQSRDSLRLDNNRLKQNSGLLGNTTLLRDFEDCVDNNEKLISRIEQLKRKHAELILNSKGIKQKIMQTKAEK